MIFHKKKVEPKKEVIDVHKEFYDSWTEIKTCCDCEILMRYLINRYRTFGDNRDFELQIISKKICDIHKTEAANKIIDKLKEQMK